MDRRNNTDLEEIKSFVKEVITQRHSGEDSALMKLIKETNRKLDFQVENSLKRDSEMMAKITTIEENWKKLATGWKVLITLGSVIGGLAWFALEGLKAYKGLK